MTNEIDWGAWAEESPSPESGEGHGPTATAGFVDEAAPVDEEDFSTPEVTPPPPAVLDPQPTKALVTLFKTEFELTLQRARTITVIRDEGTNHLATKWAGQVKKLYKRLEELRKGIVGPPNEFLREVNAAFKPFTEPLQAAEKHLSKLLGNYRLFLENEALRIQAEQEAEARRIQKQLEAEAKAAAKRDVHYEPAPIVAPVAPVVPKVTRTSEGSASHRRDWTFAVENPDAVPREYLVVDEKRIREAVKNGVREIPGVKIFEEYVTQIRA
jgi:hypothetical protein